MHIQYWNIGLVLVAVFGEFMSLEFSVTSKAMKIQYGRQDLLRLRDKAPSINGLSLDHFIASGQVKKRRPSRWKRTRGKRGGFSKFQRPIGVIVDIFGRSRRKAPEPRIPTLVSVPYLSS
jgi:hypothetical protein